MKILKKIINEIKIVACIAAYFAIVFITMMVMKKLYLKDYNIQFSGISQALIGALILSKVVILMEFISLGQWVKHQPTIVDIILRTFLYTLGVAIVIILEKAFETRHGAGGFIDAIPFVINHRDINHVWATTIGTAASLFVYNSFTVVQRYMGKKGFIKLFFVTSLNQVENSNATLKTLNH